MLKTETLDYRVPILLIILSLVPLIAGVVRLAGLNAGDSISEENMRFFVSPIPVAIHIVSSTIFCILGAFQFAHSFRVRWPAWHRLCGWPLMFFGMASAISGLWMTMFYSIPEAYQGTILYIVRLIVAITMAISIVLAIHFIVKRKVSKHRAWMTRAYALGQGAGTQVIVFLPFIFIYGDITGTPRDLLMTGAWIINMVFAERIIRA